MKKLTEIQKTEIRNFRKEGIGYKTIADKMALSRDTVRSFCVRNEIPTGKLSEELPNGKPEIKAGKTVFVITTTHSPKASETLEKKLEKLILDAASKQTDIYQFVQG